MQHYTKSGNPYLMQLREKYLPCKPESLTDLLYLTTMVLDGTVVIRDLANHSQGQLVCLAVAVCDYHREACKSYDPCHTKVVDPADSREILGRNVAQFLHMIPPGMAWIAVRNAGGGHERPEFTRRLMHYFVERRHFMALCNKIHKHMDEGFPELLE